MAPWGCRVFGSLAACRAAEWGDQIWTGELKVVARGPHVAIKLTGKDGGWTKEEN